MLRVAIGILATVLATGAFAQYPSRPLHLVVGFAPGGAADIISRAMSEPLARAFGQPIIVDNKPGAGSSLAAELVAKSAPDGYTVMIASPSAVFVNPIIMKNVGYDTARSFAPITLVTTSPLVVAVHPSVQVRTLRELIAEAKKHPGKLNFATSGNGSAPHLAAVHFMRLAGVEMVHVPYKGGGPAVQALLAGDTQLSFATPPSVLPLVQAGRLRALAITSRNGSALVPGVPGMAEAGLPDYEISFWYGFFVPTGTPREIVQRLHQETAKALALPEVGKSLGREGTETAGSRSPDEFAAFIAEDAKLWARLVKDSGAKAD